MSTIHIWSSADCTTPKNCKNCDVTEGEPRGHRWSDATCFNPKRCSRCKITEGEALEHQTETNVLYPARPGSQGIKEETCKLCGSSESSRYELTSYFSNGRFVHTPEECVSLLQGILTERFGWSDRADGLSFQEADGDTYVWTVLYEDYPILQVNFGRDGETVGSAQKNVSGLDSISLLAMFQTDDQQISALMAVTYAFECSNKQIDPYGEYLTALEDQAFDAFTVDMKDGKFDNTDGITITESGMRINCLFLSVDGQSFGYRFTLTPEYQEDMR